MAEFRLIETGDRYENGDVEYLLERNQQCICIGNSSKCYKVLLSRIRRGDVCTEIYSSDRRVTVSAEYIAIQEAVTNAFRTGDDAEYYRLRQMLSVIE